MKTKFKFLVWGILLLVLFCISTFGLTNYTSFAQASSNLEKLNIPFSVNFTEKEKKFLNSLSQTELEKLIRVIKLIVEKNKGTARQNTSNQQPTTNNQTTYSNSPSPQTPYYNQNTKQYQSTPASNSGESQGAQANPYSSNLPFSGEQQPFTQQQNTLPSTPLGALMQGVTQGITQVDNERLRSLFPDGGKGGKCEDFGTVNNMGGQSFGGASALSSKLKFDLSRLCQLTGKRLILTSGRRGHGNENSDCGSESQHNCGKAIDTSLNPYTEEEKVIVTLYFMAHGYGGIGSYGSGPMHFDHRNSSMRWGPPGPPFRLVNCRAGYYYPPVQKAFQMTGLEPCSLPQLNLTSQKAKEVLQSIGKSDFAI